MSQDSRRRLEATKQEIAPMTTNSSVSVSSSTTPSRYRASSKPKDWPKPDGARAKTVLVDTQDNNQRARRSLVVSKPKSAEDAGVARPSNRPVVEQLVRPRRPRPIASSLKRNEDDLDRNNRRELQEKLDQSDVLVKNLQAQVLQLKAELEEAQSLNLQLQSHNRKLSDDLAAAESKIAALTTREQRESIAEYQSPKFKSIQKLIGNKLENSKITKEADNESNNLKMILPSPASLSSSIGEVHRKVPECPTASSATAPPPPPPPPPRPPAKVANTTPKAPAIVELYHSLAKYDGKKNPSMQGSYNKPVVNNAHNSIVGEIQNRSTHLLAIKADIETKGDFIDGLIQKVHAAAYTDIEDVLKFVDWLDNELSTLADERAVLKHFNWPERKEDTLREAAMEYRSLKLLESEVSSYKDDSNIPCGVALKKMAGLLDKSERSIQRLISLRNSVMLAYQGYKIPTDWMLDSGIICKIKKASIVLAKMYMRRVTLEVESVRYSERESSQEALLLQSVHFAYRAYQFAGGLDSETLCALKEIRQRVPGNLRGSQELLAGIPS